MVRRPPHQCSLHLPSRWACGPVRIREYHASYEQLVVPQPTCGWIRGDDVLAPGQAALGSRPYDRCPRRPATERMTWREFGQSPRTRLCKARRPGQGPAGGRVHPRPQRVLRRRRYLDLDPHRAEPYMVYQGRGTAGDAVPDAGKSYPAAAGGLGRILQTIRCPSMRRPRSRWDRMSIF